MLLVETVRGAFILSTYNKVMGKSESGGLSYIRKPYTTWCISPVCECKGIIYRSKAVSRSTKALHKSAIFLFAFFVHLFGGVGVGIVLLPVCIIFVSVFIILRRAYGTKFKLAGLYHLPQTFFGDDVKQILLFLSIKNKNTPTTEL